MKEFRHITYRKSDILTSHVQQPVAQQQRRIRFSTAGTVRDSEMVVYMTEGQKGNAERETSLNLWICFTCNMIKALKKLVSLSFIHNLMIGDLFFHHLFFSITFLFEYTFTWFVHVHCLCHLSRWRAFLECCCSLRRGESRERTYYAAMFAFKEPISQLFENPQSHPTLIGTLWKRRYSSLITLLLRTGTQFSLIVLPLFLRLQM